MDEYETCSWCTEEVRNVTLSELPDGARLCRGCFTAYRIDPDIINRT